MFDQGNEASRAFVDSPALYIHKGFEIGCMNNLFLFVATEELWK